MRAVVQRVQGAAVSVDGESVASIGAGLLVYLGVEEGDTERDLEYMVGKVAGLRIFEDEAGAMNRSVLDAGGEALVVSQFTLLGDVRRGLRPSFTRAMEPGAAREMYERFAAGLEERGVPSRTGRFRALMHVESVNSGPVTILVDSRRIL